MTYLQHARRHLPGGTDPLPLGTNAIYLAGQVTIASLASGTGEVNVDLDPTTASWGTDAGAETPSDTFDLQQSGGTGAYGIALLKSGLYVLDVWASLNLASAPAANSCAELGVSNSNSGVGGTDTAPWVLSTSVTTQYRARPSKRTWLNWPASYATPPVRHFISIGQNSGASVPTVIVDFLVVRIGDGNTGF